MTLTPERIASFERTWSHDPEALEIARLARLGLRVEGAPVVNPAWFRTPDEFIDKRVVLVMVKP